MVALSMHKRPFQGYEIRTISTWTHPVDSLETDISASSQMLWGPNHLARIELCCIEYVALHDRMKCIPSVQPCRDEFLATGPAK